MLRIYRFIPVLLVLHLPLLAEHSDEEFLELAGMTLEELLDVKVNIASNLIGDRERQPVSNTTITGTQIRATAARNIMEVLTFFVPGFFQVQDQDDFIAGFRGIAPDNNSKVMFLLNGHSLNTEWFQGIPSGLVNGLDMEFIDHIDVIRGPGSVTLGQGALLGVINIVTKTGDKARTFASAGGGKEGYRQASLETGSKKGDLETFFHFSKGNRDGQALRREGNATRPWEGVEGDTIADSGLRLGRSDGSVAVGNLAYKGWRLDLLHADQTNDMFNFRRDRSIYQQVLTSLSSHYTFALNDKQNLKLKAGHETDDYLLHSPGGQNMGGTRETRLTVGGLWTLTQDAFSVAAGAESKWFEMGKRNRDGNNYLVNRADGTAAHPNETQQWVYSHKIQVKSLFGEAVVHLGPTWDLFSAFRYDSHPFWGSQATPRVGMLFGNEKVGNYRISYQTGFRGAPGVHYAGGFQGDGLLREDNFDEVATATQGHQPNLNPIEPEKIQSLEAEGRWSLPHGFHVDLVLFENQIQDVIGFGAFGSWIFTPVPDTIGTDIKGDWDGYWYFQNMAGEITARGAELEVQWKRGMLEVNGSHAMVRAAKVDEAIFGSLYITDESLGKHFRGYPEDVTRLNVKLKATDSLEVFANALHYGRWYQQDTQGEGQTLVNSSVALELGRHWKTQVSINNLTDSQKLVPFTEGAIPGGQTDRRPGTPGVGERSWWVSLHYLF